MEGTIGEIRLFAGNFAPQNWLYCQGQVLPIRQNEVLFSIIGTFYGGDGKTNFALPNLPSPLPNTPMQYIICLQGIYPSRP
jgi:microcystin-dependent protein